VICLPAGEAGILGFRVRSMLIHEIPLFEMGKSYLLLHKNPGEEHCLVGSLTGEVASKKVTEAYKGWLTLNGNQGVSCKRDKPA